MQSARPRRHRTGTDWLGLPAWVLLCLAVGVLGSLVTVTAVDTWLPTLRQPWFSPPEWVFPPVWTLLYILMGVAASRVWRKYGFRGAPVALGLFGVQLALNLGWSLLFFGARAPGLAFVEGLLLWAAIAATTVLFWRLDRPAGTLMAAYLLWVTFAVGLNYSLWRLNA